MPTSGNGQTQTSCTGTVYDDGGQYGAYADNINSTLTIAPTGASKVQLTFTKFRMENTYDFLYIYDGPTTASPLLGSYTGNTLPASITSTAPSITIKQLTDPAVIDTGFAINWSCILPNSPPTANFKSDITNTCAGTIQFPTFLQEEQPHGYGILVMETHLHYEILYILILQMAHIL
jgi:hypothetical protein